MQLQGIVKPIPAGGKLVKSHELIIERILEGWHDTKGKLPVTVLYGVDEAGKQSIAQNACAQKGLSLWHLPAELIPQKPDEAQTLAELWTRESALLGGGLFISARAEEAVLKNAARFIDDVPGPVFLAARERWQGTDGFMLAFEVDKPLKMEQKRFGSRLWRIELLNKHEVIPALVGQFNLGAAAIEAVVSEAKFLEKEGAALPVALWQAACEATRPEISSSPQIKPKAEMAGLVLPLREKQLLEEIALVVAQRLRVYEEWGFERVSAAGAWG